MKELDQPDRQRLARKLKIPEPKIVEDWTAAAFSHYTGTDENREFAKMHCTTDARYHLTFLRTAIEYGTQETFGQYLRWTTNVLQSRKIPLQDIREFFLQISHALDPHLSEVEKREVRNYLLNSSSESPRPEDQTRSISESPLHIHQEVFLQALLAGDRHAAKTIALEAFSTPYSLPEIYVEIFQDSLYKIGDLWESNHISVAQEHVATAIVQYVIAQMYTRVNSMEAHQGTGIITGVEGELHQVGANMVADTLEMHGWDIRFLGVNVPHKAILQMINDVQPCLVGISATMILNVPAVKDLIRGIRNQIPTAKIPRILVGGSAFRSLPNVFREIGADGFAVDLRSLGSLL
jgi:methanogenic corrinoid protein MtbC1